MELARAQNTFAQRLYQWSLSDFIRELADGCPLLSSVGINNYTVAAFVNWSETLSSGEKKVLATALTRRSHQNAAALRGESLTDEEQKYWNKEFFLQVATRQHSLPPLTSADWGFPTFKPVDPDACLDSLISFLDPALGKPSRQKSSVRAIRHFGDWKIVTQFKFYRRDREIELEYQFIRKDGQPVIGHDSPFPRNLFWFYGITNTSVDVPSESDSERMAKVMAQLGEHFVMQAGPLFDGLGLRD